MLVRWNFLHPSMTLDHLGFIAIMLDDADERPAREQFNEAYLRTGGCPWKPFKGFRMNPITKAITYPGDPPLKPVACTQLRKERIYFYDHDWVAIVQEDGSFEMCRMD